MNMETKVTYYDRFTEVLATLSSMSAEKFLAKFSNPREAIESIISQYLYDLGYPIGHDRLVSWLNTEIPESERPHMDAMLRIANECTPDIAAFTKVWIEYVLQHYPNAFLSNN